MAYRQCAKRLWLSVNRPELGEVSATTEASFAAGHQVGDIARRLYGPGVLAFDSDKPDFAGALEETKRLTEKKTGTIFEATFSSDGVLVMADVVKLTSTGARVVEVKSSTGVKDYHVEDCATQAHVIERSGLRVKSVKLAHIDNSFVYPGNGDYRGLLTEADIEERVSPIRPLVPSWIDGAKRTLEGDEPNVAPGKHCGTPFECPFFDHCNKPGAEYPVSELLRISDSKVEAFRARGIVDIRQLLETELSTPDQVRAYRAATSGQPVVTKSETAVLDGLPYPRCFLDFETIGFAIPIWAGTRPYQGIPFQWSVHIDRGIGSALEHLEFLDTTGENPGKACMSALIQALREAGPVIVYTGFEKSVLNAMSVAYPEMAKELQEIISRLLDLHPVTKASYYHRDMRGSWSIKKVLPTLAPDLSYDQLDGVQDGLMAQQAYLEAIDPKTAPDRVQSIRRSLLTYCAQDTLATVRIVDFLTGRTSRK